MTMASVTTWLLLIMCVRASAMPLSTRLSDEEEKVSRCILEVLAESLSKPHSGQVSSECLHLLKEDERVISMLRHQHLLRELEDLAHEGKSPYREGENMDTSEEDELRKRSKEASAQPHKRGDAAKRGAEREESTEHQETKEFEKVEKVEIKEKNHGMSEEEKEKQMLEEDEDDKRSPPEKRGKEERGSANQRTSESSPKGSSMKRFNEEGEDSSEEDEGEHGYDGNKHGWYHQSHEVWDEKKRGSEKRMAEDPSEEETAQFETEDKGVKYFNSKTHMQGHHGEGKRHIYYPEERELEKERGHHGTLEGELERERYYHNMRPENQEQEERELEEMEEREGHRAKDQDLQEVERELRKAAERLQELHRG